MPSRIAHRSQKHPRKNFLVASVVKQTLRNSNWPCSRWCRGSSSSTTWCLVLLLCLGSSHGFYFWLTDDLCVLRLGPCRLPCSSIVVVRLQNRKELIATKLLVVVTETGRTKVLIIHMLHLSLACFGFHPELLICISILFSWWRGCGGCWRRACGKPWWRHWEVWRWHTRGWHTRRRHWHAWWRWPPWSWRHCTRRAWRWPTLEQKACKMCEHACHVHQKHFTTKEFLLNPCHHNLCTSTVTRCPFINQLTIPGGGGIPGGGPIPGGGGMPGGPIPGGGGPIPGGGGPMPGGGGPIPGGGGGP